MNLYLRGARDFLTVMLQNPLSFRVLFYSAAYMDNCDSQGKSHDADDANWYVAHHAPQRALNIVSLLPGNIFKQDVQGRALFLLEEDTYPKVKEYIVKQLGRQPKDFVAETESFSLPADDQDQLHPFIDKVSEI
jgi:hypothetical protein